MSQESKMSMTGKNFLIAFALGLIAAILLTLVYSLMALFLNAKTSENFAAAFETTARMFFMLLKSVGLCAGPVVFLISFALLQRFRIKN